MELDFSEDSILLENEGDYVQYDKANDTVSIDITDMPLTELLKVIKTLKREVKKFKKDNFEL